MFFCPIPYAHTLSVPTLSHANATAAVPVVLAIVLTVNVVVLAVVVVVAMVVAEAPPIALVVFRAF